jgi:hypothetical protein
MEVTSQQKKSIWWSQVSESHGVDNSLDKGKSICLKNQDIITK